MTVQEIDLDDHESLNNVDCFDMIAKVRNLDEQLRLQQIQIDALTLRLERVESKLRRSKHDVQNAERPQ